MPHLYLVRHAKPAAAWGEDPDPGLDQSGRTQAEATAQQVAGRLTPVPVCSSPLRRCRETALPLAERWRASVQILPPVAEIPSPPIDPGAKRDWLAAAMRGTWRELSDAAPSGAVDYLAWRDALLESLLALGEDTVIYTHFIAINAAVGAAHGSDSVVCFRPDYASVTVVETVRNSFRLVELGREAPTSVLAGRSG